MYCNFNPEMFNKRSITRRKRESMFLDMKMKIVPTDIFIRVETNPHGRWILHIGCIRAFDMRRRDGAQIRSNADDFRSIYQPQTRTLSPIKFLYWCHFVSRQYSRKKASAYSWPWPFPNRPWVSVHAIRWFLVRSISRYSRIALLICAFGHQAPPFFSCRILQTR